ncbi:hypothetical protein [Phormidium tenue]|uniref:Uncharacterized protein n=1 Tax=Phormidium tenue NIES-30 TaxID=549789 RepID=A0A1U7J8H7_9CYAN|nr:hypothetical protein [Phormidium tenue]MBD2231334.1 hypothetical protein [Phormidium tenue FACHB-1052]OKH49571.1 hypothetical protein NIES30_06950 [Phormidium tenue NIES-30]
MTIKFCWALLGGLPLSILSSLGTAALASTIDLSVLPLLSGSQTRCPAGLMAHETPQPYVEGGFSIDGMVKLRDIATNIRLSQSDQFSATWVGTLKSEYRNCQASGGMIRIDGAAHEANSYIRIQMINGQVKATLDMTGMRDANGFTAVILFKGLRDGNPRWTWGGSD